METDRTRKVILLANNLFARVVMLDVLESLGGMDPGSPSSPALFRRQMAGVDLLVWLRDTRDVPDELMLGLVDSLLRGDRTGACCATEA